MSRRTLLLGGAAVARGDGGRLRGRAGRPVGRPAAGDADQARGRDLRREPVVRPLLRRPTRTPPTRPGSPRSRAAGDADGQRPDAGDCCNDQPELASSRAGSTAPRPVTCDHNHNYGAEQKAFNGGAMDKFVENTDGGSCARQDDRHGLLRRQHAHRDVELRPELRDERPPLRLDVRARRRSARSTSSAATRTASARSALGENGTMIANSQPALDDCSAGKGAGLATHERPQHRRPDERRRRHLGLVRGRLQADALGGQRRRGLRRDAQRTPPARTSPTTSRTTSRSSTTRRPPTRTTCRRRSVAKIGSDRPGQPPVRPDRLRRRAGRRQPAAGLVPEGRLAPRTRTPATPARSTSSSFVVRVLNALQRRRSGPRPRCSSPTTTPTAGTTTRSCRRQQGSRGPSDALNGAGVCGPAPAAGRLPGPLRPRPAPAAAARLAVGEAELRRLTRRPSRPRSPASSRTTGASGASATSRSTRAPARSTEHVRLRPGAARGAEAVPRRDDRRAGDRAGAAAIAPPRPTRARGRRRRRPPTATAEADADADRRRRSRRRSRSSSAARSAAAASGSRSPAPPPARTRRKKTTLRIQIRKGKQGAGERQGARSPRRRRRSSSGQEGDQGGQVHAADHAHADRPHDDHDEQDDPPEVVRRARWSLSLLPRGLRGRQHAPAVRDRRAAADAPSRGARRSRAPTCSPQEVADAAAGVPLNGAPAARARAAAGAARSTARSPATAPTARARRRRWPGQVGALRRALRGGRPRGGARAPGPGPTSATCGSARRTARSGTSTPRSSRQRDADRARAVDRRAAERAARRRPRGSRATCASCAGPSPSDRDHPARLRDPRPRDPRGRPARHAQRRRRALQRRGRARDRRVAGGDRRRRRHAAAAARAARRARADRVPACCGCAASWPRSAAPTAALAGARRSSRARERQRLNGRLGAGLEILAGVPRALETQYAPAIPELRP